eukprot:gnl/MRDRNA2_/MRDRNA2_83069_c0_seq1.p1 gnl/MRDRNA2_/MRDRNA2_83069_c0~~gnl/MRDRNA2_/MRDRNA2_83069_c0_seq1.p1  ORF type:complete len:2124 (-),score=461.30 gnl/MRDRNA2_/MRDRNA2_83069_c0_seq1:152-6523(-)
MKTFGDYRLSQSHHSQHPFSARSQHVHLPPVGGAQGGSPTSLRLGSIDQTMARLREDEERTRVATKQTRGNSASRNSPGIPAPPAGPPPPSGGQRGFSSIQPATASLSPNFNMPGSSEFGIGQIDIRAPNVPPPSGSSKHPKSPNRRTKQAPPSLEKLAPELPPARAEAIRACFARLDTQGKGFASAAEIEAALDRNSSLDSSAKQDLFGQLIGICSPSNKNALTFAGFSRYYQNVSQGVVRDRDFEHILNAHWGFASTSDVVAAMQKYCAMAGLAYAFQEQVSDGEGMGSVSGAQLHQGLQRIGLRLGPNDLERITGSFGSQIAIQELKELIINQRSEQSVIQSESEPSAPPQTSSKAPQPDLDLATLSRKLPFQKTPEAHAERRRMFDLIDMQSNGYLSVAELQRGIEDVLELPEAFDIAPAVMRAVKVVKTLSPTPNDRPRTSERIQRREFRMILQCISHYFELWLMFGIVDIASDSLISIQQFSAAQPKLAGWGLCSDAVSEKAIFSQINRNHNGQVLFADFCDWAVKEKLDLSDSDDDEPQKPHAPPAATRDLDIGSAQIMDIDWSTIHEKLPYKRTPEQRAERRRLFSSMDMNGNGYLSLAEFDRGIQTVLQIQQVFDAKPAIMRAYQAAKNSMPSKSAHGADYVQRTEFRILLQFLAHYFELWCVFGIIDAGNDRRINLAEFTMAVPRLTQWGVRISKADVVPIFNHIDRNHGGQVLFAEFCEWAIKQKLDLCESEDDMPQQSSKPSNQVAQDRSLPQFQQVPATNFPDLKAIHRKLPYDKDRLPERKKLFSAMDTNGNNYLSLAEVDKGIQDVLQLRELFDAKPAIMRAFNASKNIVPSKRGHPGADYVTRTEFRILLQYLWHYFELWVHFKIIDAGGDRRISLQEFSAALPALAEWGLHVQRGHEKGVFNQIDVNHGGSVLFAEFCEWAISHGATFDFNEDEDADWSKPSQSQSSKPQKASENMVKNRHVPAKKQIDWSTIHLKLPHQRTTEARQQRRHLFREFDVNGNGYLSLAEVDKGVRDVLELDELFDAKPVIMRAFQAAKNSVPADDIDSPAADYIQKMEFRILLQFLSHFFELWDLFGIIDTSHNRKLNLQEFTNILPKLGEWGIIVARGNERMVFNQIDRNHGGQVLFAEFCEWAIHLKLDLSDSDDDLPNPPRGRPQERSITPVGIDWSSIPKKLPFERTPEARSQRKRLFSAMDVNSNGYLSLAEVDKGIQDVLQIREIYDAKPVIIRAFNAAKNCVPDEGVGGDYIQRREFRMMLQFMAHFFELWVMFSIIDTSNNRCINLQEFILSVPRLIDWGAHIPKGKEKAVFNQIDQNHAGQILFAELCEWAIAQKLDIGDTDEEPMPNTPVARSKSPALGMPTLNMNRLPTVQPLGRPRRRKALSIGINYFSLPTNHQLINSVNDSNAIIQLLVNVMGFDVSDIRQLRDDQPHAAPTRAHILAGLSWLVDGAQPGDEFFLHYSGHANAEDGETLLPCDFQESGALSEEELRQAVVLKLPEKTRLTVLLDCGASSAALGLPFKVVLHNDNETASIVRKPKKFVGEAGQADVVVVCGRQEKGNDFNAATTDPRGTLTAAMRTTLEQNNSCTYHELLQHMRSFMKRCGASIVPLLSAEHFLDLEGGFFSDAKASIPVPLPPPARPPTKRALTVGINYLTLPRGRGQLSGCINDSDTMIGILSSIFNIDERQVRRLRDDSSDPSLVPTRSNILRELQELVRGSVAGDELFFHYSGHGTQVADTNSDEADGKDEALVPCDFQHSGLLKDDTLRKAVVDQVPPGVKLVAVLDCCHSGSVFDMPFKVMINPDDRSVKVVREVKSRLATKSQGEVIMISGCNDDQTSADVAASSMQNRKAAGAMTMAFKHCLTQDLSCHKLLQRMRRFLKKHGYRQVPQMHSEEFLRLDEPFAAYTCKTKVAIAESNPGQAPKTRDLPMGSPISSTNQLPPSTGSLDEQLKEMEAQLDNLRKKKAAELQQTTDMGANHGGNNISSISTTPSQGGFSNFASGPEQRNAQTGYNNRTPPYSDNDVDGEITEMENHLRTLKRKKQSTGGNAGDVDAQIASVEAHLQRLKSEKYGGQGAGTQANMFGGSMQVPGFAGRVAAQQPHSTLRW